ncbi:MAG: alkaline phosphatase family protein [Anaerolineae bacterium]
MSPPRLLVVGLDGATFDVIRPLVAQGRLPHLARLLAQGSSGPLRSTLPPVTAAAWSTFMTGQNPGRHGIFQWRTYDPTTYTGLDERIVTASRLVGRTFWDYLGAAGWRAGVITVPVTYPPWPLNGFMLSGYPCPDAQKNYTFPPELSQSLPESYNFSVDHYLNATPRQILNDGLEMLARRTSLALQTIDEMDLDLCVLVLGEIDRAQHDFWRYADARFPEYAAAGDGFRQAIARHYEVSDQQLGRLLEMAGDDVPVIVMSDHGGGPHPRRYFHTNAWLRQQGWLATRHQAPSLRGRLLRQAIAALRRRLPFEEKLRRLLPAGLVNRARRVSLNIADVDWSRTRAYRFNMYHPAEGIEINLRGRQPGGIVAPGAEFEALLAEIMAALRRATDPQTGQPIVAELYRKEELYDGPYLEIAPDLVAVLDAGHKAGIESAGPFTAPVPLGDLPRDHSGVHTMDGILIARGPGIRRGATLTGAQIGDLAPTILYLAGQPVPAGMDGRVLEALFEPEHLAAHPPVRADPTQVTIPDTGAVSDDDDAAMRDKLRGLGYID